VPRDLLGAEVLIDEPQAFALTLREQLGSTRIRLVMQRHRPNNNDANFPTSTIA
jgi:hypothetical protein